MKGIIVDENRTYKYDDLRDVHVKNGKLTIGYIGTDGEYHQETGPIPDAFQIKAYKKESS